MFSITIWAASDVMPDHIYLLLTPQAILERAIGFTEGGFFHRLAANFVSCNASLITACTTRVGLFKFHVSLCTGYGGSAVQEVSNASLRRIPGNDLALITEMDDETFSDLSQVSLLRRDILCAWLFSHS